MDCEENRASNQAVFEGLLQSQGDALITKSSSRESSPFSNTPAENIRHLFDRIEHHSNKNSVPAANPSNNSWFSLPLPSFATPNLAMTQTDMPAPPNPQEHEIPMPTPSTNHTMKEVSVLRESMALVTREKEALTESLKTLQERVRLSDERLRSMTITLGERDREVAHLRQQSTINPFVDRDPPSSTRTLQEMQQLRLSVDQLRTKNADLELELREMRRRLKQYNEQIATLGQENMQLVKDLEMARLHLAQVSGTMNPASSSTQSATHEDLLETTTSHKSEQHLVAELRRNLQEMETEHRTMVADWRKHCEMVERECEEKCRLLSTLGQERDGLWERCILLEAEVDQLKAQTVERSSPVAEKEPLAVFQLKEDSESEGVEDAPKPTEDAVNSSEPCGQCVQWQQLVTNLQTRLWESQCSIERMADQLAVLQEASDAKEQLFLTVQGDRTALSRALTQNRQLKAFNEELEAKFVAMSEDNMSTKTKLQQVEHENKELRAYLQAPSGPATVSILQETSSVEIQVDLGNFHLEEVKAALYQLEAERDQLLKETKSHHILVMELEELRREYQSLQAHCQQVEVCNKRLEVEVLQLDGETHTIGEYVALYRSERDKLMQRARAWQALAQRLSAERETVFHQLGQLQNHLNGTGGGAAAMEAPPEETSRQTSGTFELDDDASELEAIVFSKEAPLEGRVVDLNAEKLAPPVPQQNSNSTLVDPQGSPTTTPQDWRRIAALLNVLRDTCKPLSLTEKFLVDLETSDASVDSTPDTDPPSLTFPLRRRLSASEFPVNTCVAGKRTSRDAFSVFVPDLPSCKCCSGRLLII